MSMLAEPMTASWSSKTIALAWSMTGHIQQDPPAGHVQIAQVTRPGQIGGDVVRAARHDQPHIDTAAGGQRESPGEHFVRHEIRRDDPDPVAGREHQRQQRFIKWVAGDIGTAGHDLHHARLHPQQPGTATGLDWPRPGLCRS